MEASKKLYFNSSSAIESAIRSGKIQFADGVFKGDFNAKLAKEFRSLGMKLDRRIKGYRKDINSLPVNLQVVIAQTESSYTKTAESMIKAIDNIVVDMKTVSFQSVYSKAIDNVDSNFTKTVGISVDLTEGQREVITKEFSENLELFVKDFSDKQVLILRKEVETAVFEGIRAEELQKIIVDRFDVSQKKAKFLAKQEISLLTSKYKSAKYREVGINKYRWSISNVRTRPDHKALNGKVYSFDDPPITNQDTGARNNPSEDFGCECVAIPIVEV